MANQVGQEEESTISYLDGLIREFYSHESSNERKKEIESMLNAFSSRDDSYIYCLKMLFHESSYGKPAAASLMFCLSVLERIVLKVGTNCSMESGNNKTSTVRLEILMNLWKFLTKDFNSMPSYIRNKTGKVIADVGLLEWPSSSLPDFMNDIICLIHSKDTAVIGLFLLDSTVEEWTAVLSRQDQQIVSESRKETLTKLLSSQIPMILSLLINILDSMTDQITQGIALSEATATTTPPPSPTSSSQGIVIPSSITSSANSSSSSIHGSSSSSLPSSSLFLLNNPHLGLGSAVTSAFHSRSLGDVRKDPASVGFDLDNDSIRICYSCLSCIGHLISWMPLQSFLTCFHSTNSLESFMSSLFFFSGFGCIDLSDSLSRIPGLTTTNDSSVDAKRIGILAMNCFNEISAKNCITPDNMQFMSDLFQTAFKLVQEFLKKDDADPGLLLNLDDEYLSKCTEFLRLFISAHFPRLESMTGFPVDHCLSLMFQYTFKLSSDRLTSCLEIWNIFVDYVLTQKVSPIKQGFGSCESRYQTSLVLLAKEISLKMQYKMNWEQIEAFDENAADTANNNNSLTEGADVQMEWKFTTHCIEILAKIAEVIPSEVFALFSEIFTTNLPVFVGLQDVIGKGILTGNSSNDEIDRIHWSLKDLVTSVQSMGRLSSNFTHEFFDERYSVTKIMLQNLIDLLKYPSTKSLYSLRDLNHVVLMDVVHVHSEVIASIRSYSYWMMQTSTSVVHDQDFKQLVTYVVDECVSIITSGAQESRRSSLPSQVTHAAIHCLSSIHDTIRHQIFLSLPSIHSLVKTAVSSIDSTSEQRTEQNKGDQDSHCLNMELTRSDELVLLSFISKMFILPWAHIPDSSQEWSNRAIHHDHVITAIISPVKSLVVQSNSTSDSLSHLQSCLKLAIKRTLPVISFTVQSHQESPTRSKQILMTSLQETIGLCIHILDHFQDDDEVGEELLFFFSSLFNVLRGQIKKEVIEQVIGIILRVFASKAAQDAVQGSSSQQLLKNRSKLMENLLKLLTFIVQQPVFSYKPHASSMIPGIVSLVLNQVSPLVSLDDDQTGVTAINQSVSDPEVVSTLFDFYHELLNNNFKYFFGTKPTSSVLVDHEAEFVKIMESYGRSFVSSRTDIQVYRKNLTSLQVLHQKFNLFDKDYFRRNLWKDFLSLFLRTFVCKTHELFHDELISIIYDLASVDLNSFHSLFLPDFVSNLLMSTSLSKDISKDSFPASRDLPSFSLNLQKFSTDLRFSQTMSSS